MYVTISNLFVPDFSRGNLILNICFEVYRVAIVISHNEILTRKFSKNGSRYKVVIMSFSQT